MLEFIEDILWVYFAYPAILATGLYFTFSSRFVQFRSFGSIVRNFFSMFRKDIQEKSPQGESQAGIHPLKAFFASIGGCVGIGNIVGVTTAVQLGGPGALFWIWVAALIGSLAKYAEVFLGMRYRVKTSQGYRGGPMYVLTAAFGGSRGEARLGSWLVKAFCILMCIYGVEIFQFSVMTSSVAENYGIAKPIVALVFLALVIAAECGGLKRIGTICSTIIPLFIALYIGMGSYVLVQCASAIPSVIGDVFRYAFTSHAAVGAFTGGSLMLAMSQGIKRACYSLDVGVGYASIIHSESTEEVPAKQAALTIFEVFLDTFIICTMSIVLVLVTGTWTHNIDAIYLVQSALASYFPYMHFFIPLFLFLLGYSTIIAYFCAGMKTALFLSPKRGRLFYYVYAVTALIGFSFADTEQAASVMMIVLALLLAMNLAAAWKLRHEVHFRLEDEATLPVPEYASG